MAGKSWRTFEVPAGYVAITMRIGGIEPVSAMLPVDFVRKTIEEADATGMDALAWAEELEATLFAFRCWDPDDKVALSALVVAVTNPNPGGGEARAALFDALRVHGRAHVVVRQDQAGLRGRVLGQGR
jgi:hypothetical protein